MPTTLLLPVLLVTASLGMLAWVMSVSLRPARSRSLANLHRGEVLLADETKPAGLGMAIVARRLTASGLVALLEKQHARAGRPADWTVDRLLVLKLIWSPISVATIVILALTGVQAALVLLAIGVAVLVYFLPELLLLSRGQERDQKIAVELADTLDQMTIAVEAGLGFDAAMTRAATNGKGALAEELTRTLQDMRMGQPRRQAFADLAARAQVADLRQFVRAIMQADANGISVGDVLRAQASEMRLKRRQRAEKKAQQVPVKVVMPLIICILPTLFIVVIGPAAVNMVAAFSSI